MSTENPSTTDLANALSAVAREIKEMRYDTVTQKVHEWQEVHSVVFNPEVGAVSAALDTTVTQTLWENTRKKAVTLAGANLSAMYQASRTNVGKISLCSLAIRTQYKTPIQSYNFIVAKSGTTLDFWNQQYIGSTRIPLHVRIEPNEKIEASLRVKTAAVTKTGILVTCAITVED